MQTVLDEFSADLILVQANAPVRSLLGKSGSNTEGWQVIYEDPVFLLYSKEAVKNGVSSRSNSNANGWELVD